MLDPGRRWIRLGKRGRAAGRGRQRGSRAPEPLVLQQRDFPEVMLRRPPMTGASTPSRGADWPSGGRARARGIPEPPRYTRGRGRRLPEPGGGRRVRVGRRATARHCRAQQVGPDAAYPILFYPPYPILAYLILPYPIPSCLIPSAASPRFAQHGGSRGRKAPRRVPGSGARGSAPLSSAGREAAAPAPASGAVVEAERGHCPAAGGVGTAHPPAGSASPGGQAGLGRAVRAEPRGRARLLSAAEPRRSGAERAARAPLLGAALGTPWPGARTLRDSAERVAGES